MDKKATIHESKEKVRKFCEARDWDQFHPAKDLALGIVTEACELIAHFRFKSDKEVEELFKDLKKRAEIEDEAADVLYFLLRFAQKYRIDLSKALDDKIRKNELRYPINKFKGSNKKYSEI